MDYTYLDYFNFYLKEFLNELIAYFPETKNNILDNYRFLLEDKDKKSDLYVKYFMSRANEHLELLAKRNEELFAIENLCLLEGINFNTIWTNSVINDANRKAIWKYLQLLVLLGRKVIPNKSEIIAMLQKVGTKIETPERIDETLNKKDNTIDDAETSGPLNDILNMGQTLGGLGDIGNLFGENGINDIAKGLGDMMKNIDIEEISKNIAQGMQDATDLEIVDDSTASENASSENASSETASSETASSENTSSENVSSENASSGNASSGNAPADNIFKNNLFKDLAEEMTNTFDFAKAEELSNDGAPIGDVFKNFMSGDNPKKLMGLVGKFGNKLQKDISAGKIDQKDLLRQTSQMMGNLGDVNELNSQMNNANLNQRQQNKVRTNLRNQTARERLKAKLEKRNKNNSK